MVDRHPRIFHIHLGDKGGAENFFVRLVQAFHEAGVEQMALTRPNRVWHTQLSQSCAIETGRFSSSHIKKFFGHRRVRSMVRRFEADIVMAWMAPAARWVPSALPNVATLVRLGDFPDRMEPLYRCQNIVGNTPEIIDRCVALGWPKANGHVVSNFVDPVDVTAIDRGAIGVTDDSFLIVALGRFVERKGFIHLLEAIRQRPETSLCLLGDGPLRLQFEAFIAENGFSDRVVMPGWDQNPQRYIRAADALCCPSLEEPLGNVVLEGWACGIPVIASDSEGPSWLIQDGVDGLLCKKGDGAALADQIHRLQAQVDAAKLVSAAGETLAKRYSKQTIVEQYLALFRHIMSQRAV